MLQSVRDWVSGPAEGSADAKTPPAAPDSAAAPQQPTDSASAAADAPLPIDALLGRSVSAGLGGRKLCFRPQLFWQEVLPEHAVSSSLQFHCDLASGRNFARLPARAGSDGAVAEVAATGSYARSVARAVADAEVPDAEEERLVGRALRETVQRCGDGDDVAVAMTHLLCSCYCSRCALEEALCEAAKHDRPRAAEVLLAAGARPNAQPEGLGKSALHVACAEGAEAVARLLVAAEPTAAHAPAPSLSGRTPLQVARDADLGGLARRLEQYARECENGPG